MKQTYVMFVKGISSVSKLIKKITGSEFSHVAYVKDVVLLDLIECWNTEKLGFLDYISPKRFNKKMCWKYTNFHKHHTPGTEYVILCKTVPDEVYEQIDQLFEFIATYNIPYDVIGLLSRLNKHLDTKYGFYCSEGVQNVLNFVQKQNNCEDKLTDDIPGYITDPGKLYNILLKNGWSIYKEETDKSDILNPN